MFLLSDDFTRFLKFSKFVLIINCRCRKDEFATIVPRQPYRPELLPNEVRLEFEAVLLDVNKDRKNQLWIHAKIKACVTKKDCEAVSTIKIFAYSYIFQKLMYFLKENIFRLDNPNYLKLINSLRICPISRVFLIRQLIF